MREPLSPPPCAGSRRTVVRLNGLAGRVGGAVVVFDAGEICAGAVVVCAKQRCVAMARREAAADF